MHKDYRFSLATVSSSKDPTGKIMCEILLPDSSGMWDKRSRIFTRSLLLFKEEIMYYNICEIKINAIYLGAIWLSTVI